MSDQDNGQVATLQRPTTNDSEAWRTYWAEHRWSWRTEPEIDEERQKYLDERRKIAPDIVKGIYPFKEIKLNRADVEWLLATHEDGKGPIDFYDIAQRGRRGLDLRGADLRGVNLRKLPLARVQCRLYWQAWNEATQEQRCMAKTLLTGVILNRTHLEAADFRETDLEGVSIRRAFLEKVDFRGVNLKRTKLNFSDLTEAHLREAHLEGCDLSEAYLVRTRLHNANLSDEKGIGPQLVDIHWDDVNFAIVNLLQMKMLGEEGIARQKSRNGVLKNSTIRLNEYEQAVRVNRQLVSVLQAQGLNEVASHFAYRAQMLQHIVLRRQKKFGQYLFSGFLDLLAGYGYRPGRSVLWYLATILVFALAYHFLGGLITLSPGCIRV